MGACDLIQGYNLADVESLPSCLERLVDVASRLDLCLGWHIVAADEEESGVHKDKLPDRNLRHWGIRGIGRYGTALRQYLRIGLDIRSESHFDYVMNCVGSQRPNALNQAFPSQQNFIRSCSRCNFLITVGTASGNYSRSRLVSELNGTSPDRTSTALHQNCLSFH